MTKLSHPMTSCESAHSWNTRGRLRSLEHSTHVIDPHPRRYRRRRSFKSGFVPVLSIQLSASFVDSRKAALGNKRCVDMFCHICGNLGRGGFVRPGEKGTSLYLLRREPA
jgi:hypothetical protein